MATILGAYKIQYFTTYFYFIVAVFYGTLLVINIVTISHVYSVIHCYIGAIADRSVCQLSKRIALLSMQWLLILLFFYEQQLIPHEASGNCNYVHTLCVALPVNNMIYMTALCESLITCLIPRLRIQEQFLQFLLFVFNITVH